MPLDHAWLLAHIPHHGTMCLLDQVDAWDTKCIRCRASSHRTPNNPLRAHDRLGAVCGIEYAAQAMAAHSSLLTNTMDALPRVGYLASVRNVDLYVERLDDILTDLHIAATCLSSDGNTSIYDFTITASDQLLLGGRVVVVLNAAKLEQLT